MIESIVITKIGEMNQPWYGLIMKYDQPSAAVIIVKLGKHVLFLDPTAMSHGKVNIRNYQSFATLYNSDAETCAAFDQLLGETSRKANTSHYFRNTGDKLIYSNELAQALRQFPRNEGQYFASAALREAAGQINAKKELEAKVKSLETELAQLKAKKKKKRPSTPQY